MRAAVLISVAPNKQVMLTSDLSSYPFDVLHHLIHIRPVDFQLLPGKGLWLRRLLKAVRSKNTHAIEHTH